MSAKTIDSELTLTVSASDWSQYLRLKAEANSLKNQIAKLEASFGFPAPEELASQFGMLEGDKATVQVLNGNGDTIGKLTVFYFPGSETPPAWRKRIS